jgi:hypothetical protein
MKSIPRRTGLTETSFIEEHVKPNQPVIVTDAQASWRAPREWGPRYLAEKVGDMEVQVYDNLFTLLDVERLDAYLARNFDKPDGVVSNEYVRGYARFKDLDFAWSDSLFLGLAPDWGHPYFFPHDSFVLPRAPKGHAISPVSDIFPYKGIFISGRGARTRLHRDPFGTEAMLCQFYGEKQLLMFEPRHADKVMSNGQCVDPAAVDDLQFPSFKGLAPTFEDALRPGEILFIPGGWFHDVLSLSDSISITWNFVHSARSEPFLREVDNPKNTFDRDMLAFFGGFNESSVVSAVVG